VEPRQTRLNALYDAAIVADENAKLSVFCTRPGIRSPVFNWIVVSSPLIPLGQVTGKLTHRCLGPVKYPLATSVGGLGTVVEISGTIMVLLIRPSLCWQELGCLSDGEGTLIVLDRSRACHLLLSACVSRDHASA